jgi:branched-chain amino acid transport system permease protein
VARLVGRLSHLALAVATILIADIIVYLIAGFPDLTGGHVGLPGVPPPSFMVDIQSAAIVGVVLAAGSTLVLQRVARSQQGRALRTIAADKILANSVGISMPARLSAAFALSAGMAGVAGWFYAHSRLFMTPDALSVNISLTVLFMVIVGGSRTVIGPVVGAVGLTSLQDLVPQSTLGPMYYGLALIVVLLIMPRGLFGTDWRQIFATAKAKHGSAPRAGGGPRRNTNRSVNEEVPR